MVVVVSMGRSPGELGAFFDFAAVGGEGEEIFGFVGEWRKEVVALGDGRFVDTDWCPFVVYSP